MSLLVLALLTLSTLDKLRAFVKYYADFKGKIFNGNSNIFHLFKTVINSFKSLLHTEATTVWTIFNSSCNLSS